MERYTRKNAEARFTELCKVLGKRIANSHKDVGAWFLDYIPQYGGFIISEYMANGGESHPVCNRRMPAREFCETINFAIRCIALDRPDQPAHVWYPADKPITIEQAQ
jgi:hypothetical protein